MSASNKVDLVIEILRNNVEIREWYKNQFNFTEQMVSAQNINTYGTGGYGDLTDMIISDAVEAGRVSAEIAYGF